MRPDVSGSSQAVDACMSQGVSGCFQAVKACMRPDVAGCYPVGGPFLRGLKEAVFLKEEAIFYKKQHSSCEKKLSSCRVGSGGLFFFLDGSLYRGSQLPKAAGVPFDFS